MMVGYGVLMDHNLFTRISSIVDNTFCILCDWEFYKWRNNIASRYAASNKQLFTNICRPKLSVTIPVCMQWHNTV